MHVSTCSNLLDIKLNGPDPQNVQLVAQMAEEVFELWKSRKKRNPNKAHFMKRPRKNQFVSRPALEVLADGFNDDPTGAAAAAADDDEAEAAQPATAEEETQAEATARIQATSAVFASAPPLTIPAGWQMLSTAPKLTKTGMKGLKIVHIFTSGWAAGSWRPTKSVNGLWNVFYPDDLGSLSGMLWEQSLLTSDYGQDGKWVAIKRQTKAQAAATAAAASAAAASSSSSGAAGSSSLPVEATPVAGAPGKRRRQILESDED